jgi:prevent-host-death family protein
MKVNVLEAKNRLSQLIKAAQQGEDVVIANRGEPVVRLVPIELATRRAERGSAEGILDWIEHHPLPPYTQRSPQEIEASIEEERSVWD